MLERLEFIIDAVSGGAVRDLEKVGATSVATGAEVNAMGGAMQATSLKTRLLGAEGQNMGLLVKGAAVLATAAVVKFGIDGAEKFAQLTGEVRQYQRVAQSSAEDTSKFVATAKVLGIGVDQLTTATARWLKNMGTGSAVLSDYNIQVVKTKDGNIDVVKTFENVADQMSHVKDAQARATEGNALFGRGWTTLSPILGKSKKELEDLFATAEKHGLIFSQSDLEAGRQMKLNLAELHASVDGLEVAFGRMFVPLLSGAASAVTAVLDVANGMAGVTGESALIGAGIGFAFGGPAGAAIGATAAGVMSFASSTEHADVSQYSLGATMLGSAASSVIAANKLNEHAAAAEKDAIKTQMASTAVWGQIDAELAYQGSELGVAQAIQSNSKALFDAAAAKGQDTNLNLAAMQSSVQLDRAIRSATEAAATSAQANVNSTDKQVLAIAADAGRRAELEALKMKFPELSGVIDGFIAKLDAAAVPRNASVTVNVFGIDRLDRAQAAINQLLETSGQASINFGFGDVPIRRAGGGPVGAGRAYMVGEEGPELAYFPQAGQIIPNGAFSVAGAGSVASVGGSAPMQIGPVYIQGAPGTDWVAIGKDFVKGVQAYVDATGHTSWVPVP